MSKDKATTAALLGGTTPFRHAYSGQLKSQICFLAQGRTKQEFKDESDINVIMSRYLKTGMLDYVTKHQPQYLDVTSVDFQNAMDVIAKSKSMFQDLPAALRSRFENDAAKFLDFVHDAENIEEMHELGLLRADYKKPEPQPTPTPPAPTPPVPANAAPGASSTVPDPAK